MGARSLRKWGIVRAQSAQRIDVPSLVEAVTGLPTVMTVASMRPLGTLTRAGTPNPATIVAQIRDTTTIFRWVPRSAVNIEELFMASSQVSSIGRLGREKGSLGV